LRLAKVEIEGFFLFFFFCSFFAFLELLEDVTDVYSDAISLIDQANSIPQLELSLEYPFNLTAEVQTEREMVDDIENYAEEGDFYRKVKRTKFLSLTRN